MRHCNGRCTTWPIGKWEGQLCIGARPLTRSSEVITFIAAQRLRTLCRRSLPASILPFWERNPFSYTISCRERLSTCRQSLLYCPPQRHSIGASSQTGPQGRCAKVEQRYNPGNTSILFKINHTHIITMNDYYGLSNSAFASTPAENSGIGGAQDIQLPSNFVTKIDVMYRCSGSD